MRESFHKKHATPRRKKNGFTMVELVLVITLLVVLAVSALPVFYDITGGAKASSRNGVLVAVHSGINSYLANSLVNTAASSFPATLDSVADDTFCSSSSPCFVNIIQNGITSNYWKKINSTSYGWCSSAGGSVVTTYVYDPTTGLFQ